MENTKRIVSFGIVGSYYSIYLAFYGVFQRIKSAYPNLAVTFDPRIGEGAIGNDVVEDIVTADMGFKDLLFLNRFSR